MNIESKTIRHIMWRLLPFLAICYFVAYIDRVNIGVASLTMNHDLGLSPKAFGFGAGIYFLGDILFEVPSTLALNKFGARRWVARIMISWGVISGCMALVHGATGFYIVRFLLGCAEAGFYPGITFFLFLWFPTAYRARALSYFAIALPISNVIGAPLSAALLGLNGVAGIEGWRWLFLLEALPSIILGAFVWFYLTDRPEHASWLPEEGRSWLVGQLAHEQRAKLRFPSTNVMRTITRPAVLALGVAYLGVGMNAYGLAFFLPQIVKTFGLSNLQTGFVSAIPFLFGTLGMIIWSKLSDRSSKRRVYAALPLGLAGLSMIAAGLLTDPYLRMVAICLGALGTFSALPTFWSLPTVFLSGSAAAVGFATINACANFSGFLGPYTIGYFRQLTGSFGGGLIVIGGTSLLSSLIVLVMRPKTLTTTVDLPPSQLGQTS